MGRRDWMPGRARHDTHFAHCTPGAARAGPTRYGLVRPGKARPPQLTSRESAKDWDKVMDKLYRRQFGEARQKLAEWETKHGETEETRDLASQLDELPEDVLRRDDD